MKTSKFLSIIGIVFLLSIAGGTVYAGLNENIYCTVLIQDLSVSLSSSSYPFGALATSGSSEPLAQTITVTNDGNVTEDYDLSIAYSLTGGGTAWTPVTAAPAAHQFRMSAMFSTTANAAGSYDGPTDALTTGVQTASATKFAIDLEGVGLKGYSVATSATRDLNFRFEAPTATDVTAQQYITVTITATAS
ncbi:hypothetical protein KAU39_00030 [bacterium]|nr:hypothetical protein [bacterium]